MVTTLQIPEMLPQKFELLFKRRYVFAIEGLDMFFIKSAALPDWTTEEVAINWINSTRYVAGKTTFNELQITLHNAIAPAAQQQVVEWSRMVYEPVTGRGGWADFYKRDCSIKLLDAVGNVVSEWSLKGVWPKQCNFGDLTSEGSDAAEIQVTLRYDVAVLLY